MRILSYFLLFFFNGLGIISYAQPDWSVNPHAFEFSMTITGRVFIDGQISADKGDKIAVFAGNECRGVTNILHDQGLNGYFVYLMVYSNKMGEALTFYVYDASRNEILKVQNALSFSVNTIVGSPDEPYLFKAISLSPAWRIMDPEIRIYPNPFKDQLHVDISGERGDFRLYVYSADCRLVKSLFQESIQSCTLNTGDISPGIYYLEWRCGKEWGRMKLIKH